jgi:predicted RNA-binding protein with RPS1 domain
MVFRPDDDTDDLDIVLTKPKKKKGPAKTQAPPRMDFFEEDEYSKEEYEALMEMYDETLSSIEEGEIVKARVLRVTDAAVILDVGFKSEGSISRDEFKNPDQLQPGDEVEVFLENLEDAEGVVVLSKKKADFLRVWEKIKEAYESNDKVPGTLQRKIKGGVTVDLMGVDAFLPGSQIALRRVPNIEDLIGQTFEFKIIKLNKRRRNIVVSRRVILEEERETKREQLVKELLVGQVRKGVVKNVTDFGAFIDLGGLDGLLHITDMSWGRVGHPSEIVSIGDELDVKVLDIDWNRERISLGLKQLLPYPWKDIERKYPGRCARSRQGGFDHELRGVHGFEKGVSWSRAYQRDELDAQRSTEIRCDRRRDRSGGPQGRSRGREDLARHEADRAESVARTAGEVPGGHAGIRQSAEPDLVRGLRGDRARHRRPGAHLGHVLDQAGAASVGSRARVMKSRCWCWARSENKRISSVKQTQDDPWRKLPSSSRLAWKPRARSCAWSRMVLWSTWVTTSKASCRRATCRSTRRTWPITCAVVSAWTCA